MKAAIGFLMAMISWWAIPTSTAEVEQVPCNVKYAPHGTLSHADPYAYRKYAR